MNKNVRAKLNKALCKLLKSQAIIQHSTDVLWWSEIRFD